MRSWTREAKASFAFSSMVFPAAATREYRLERSRRVTLPRPVFWQMDTALVDHADWNASRGPTSTTESPVSWVASVKRSGSKVSRRSHWSVFISSAVSAEVTSTLKHCSVTTEAIAPFTAGLALALRHSVAPASSLRKGRRKSCTTLRVDPPSEPFPAAAAPGSATTARTTLERRDRGRARWPARGAWSPAEREPAAAGDARCAREEATALIGCE
mmetsp:Transcript_8874/g.40320  ORF Transcript_8874/g.40320 Transcript_8874/m.40320 type:complete len:215 (+) Transcript_8874:2878-3522(+)